MKNRTFSVLIADDEPLAIDSIKVLLDRTKDCELIGVATNGQDAFNHVLKLEPDIVFIDIQMPFLTGMDVLERFNGKGVPFFILVTAYEDQALKAFELNALDYLLKPYSDERFYQSLSRAKEHVRMYSLEEHMAEIAGQLQNNSQHTYQEFFPVKSSGKVEFLKTSEISHLNASGNYVEFVTAHKKTLSRVSLVEIERELNPTEFVRIHRSTIVRKSEIQELQSYFNGEYIVIMKNGDQLKMSRTFKNNLPP